MAKRLKVTKSKGGSGTKQSEFSKEQVADALKAAYGIKSQAVKKLIKRNGKHLSTAQLNELITRYDLGDVLYECSESFVDLAETSIAQQIREKNTSATIFTLKTKGKHRGWGESTEIKISDLAQALHQVKKLEEAKKKEDLID